MVRYFAFSAMLVALAPFQWSAKPLPQTMKSQLEQRGFAPGTQGNAPDDIKVDHARVWALNPANPAVQLVARQFGPRTPVVKGQPDFGVGIVVVVGNNFQALAKAPLQVVARRPAEICSPAVLDTTS